jgi:hypothetical protein
MLMALFPSPGGDYGELIRAVSALEKSLPPYEIGDHKSNHILDPYPRTAGETGLHTAGRRAAAAPAGLHFVRLCGI